MSGFEDRYISVGGIKTRYWQAGSQGSPVILLHGIGCSVLDWQANMAVFAERHRVFAIDMLGFGRTDKPSGETYTVPRLARFALDFLSAQAIPRAHVAGFSLGGRIALECALMAPDRVASLLLAAPAGIERRGVLIHFRLASIPWVGEMLMRPNRVRMRAFWQLAFADPSFVTAEFLEPKVDLAGLPGAQAAFLKMLRSGLGLGGIPTAHVQALHAALPTAKAPAFVIWGTQDKFLSVAHAETLQRLLPNARTELYDPCGHLPQIECAARFNQAALDFWGELDRRDAVGGLAKTA